LRTLAYRFINLCMEHKLEPDRVVKVVIPYFIRSLMRIERDRLGLAQKDASISAGWSPAVWGALERGAKPLDRDQWTDAVAVLHLETSDVVKRLNAFINKFPSIWLEKIAKDTLSICDRPVTSPRILRSGKVVNVDLNPLRPNLYHELSAYSAEPTDIIAFAVDLNFYAAQPILLPPSGGRERISAFGEDRREHVIQFIRDLPQEKFGLLERIIDKFERYSSKDLAQAYEHFSLSVKKQ
jgi:hypothetical protein